MRNESEKIRGWDHKPDCQTYLGIEAGLELDFFQIMNAVGQGLIVTGEGWRFDYVNPAFAQMVGRPLEDLIGKTMDDFVIPEDLPLLTLQRSKRLIGEPSTYELRLRRSDEEIVYVHVTGVPRRLKDTVVGSVSVIIDLTGRVNTEKALKESENKYKTVFENTGTATVIVEEDSIISLANAKFEKLIGYTKDEIEGKKSWTEFVAKDDLERMKTQHRLRRETPDIALKCYEFRLMDKNGQIKDILLTIDMIPGTRRSVASLLDISERKQAQKELRLHSEIMTNMAEGVVLVRVSDSTIVYANRKFETMFGYGRGELVGKNISVVSAPTTKSPEEIAEGIRRSLRKTGVWSGEVHDIKKDGTLFWGYVSISTFEHDEHGQVWVAVHEDISERKQMTEELRESEELFRSITEQTSDFVALTDAKGFITFASPASRLLFHFAPEEMCGHHFAEFLSWSSTPKAIAAFHNDRKRNVWSKELELTMKRKDGSFFVGELNGSNFRYGKKNGTIVVIRDISERKQAEEALVKKSADLARSNADLMQFAYVCSHDLQEPLRMVTSYVQLLEKRYKGKLDPDADEFIGYIVEGTKRMKQLLNDLLAYSRVGRRGNPLQTVDSETVLKTALQNLKIVLEESKGTVTHDPLPEIIADESQMVQLFQNLINNGLKFHGPQPPLIHVSAKQEGTNWIFSFQDNGIGIDPQYFEKIFVVFQRLHTRDKYPGTGIGLAIAKKIVERHGGHIWVESEPGKGCTVCYTLPLANKVG